MSKQQTCQVIDNGILCGQPAYRDRYCQKHWPHQAFILASWGATVAHQIEYGNPGTGTPVRYRKMEEIYRNLTGEELAEFLAREHMSDGQGHE